MSARVRPEVKRHHRETALERVAEGARDAVEHEPVDEGAEQLHTTVAVATVQGGTSNEEK